MGFKIIKVFGKTFVETKDHLTHVNALQRSRNTGPHGGASMSAKKMSKKMFKNLKSKVGWFEHSTYAQVNHTVRPGLVFVVKRCK